MLKKLLHNESELLLKISKGDQVGFNELFKYYHKFVFAYSYKLTRSENLAVEIVQDIFLKVWFHREKLNKIENFGAYLNRLVRNHCFNVLRQLAQENKIKSVLKITAREEDYSTTETLDYMEVQRILDDALKMLSPQQKMVYHLCHQQGMTYDLVAQKMNISPQTVHAYMKDALRKLRMHFKTHTLEYLIFAGIFLQPFRQPH